jgi:hypothetical protein
MGAASKKLSARVRLSPGEPARLKKRDPGDTLGLDSEDAARVHQAAMIDRLNDLQYRLYAENQRSVLLVLQGMDTSGKDGTIRHVMSGLDPSACHVTSFKAPSAEELDHDFLWRVHKAVPARGQIGVFNRSHYEDVLIARVRKLVPARVWNARYLDGASSHCPLEPLNNSRRSASSGLKNDRCADAVPSAPSPSGQDGPGRARPRCKGHRPRPARFGRPRHLLGPVADAAELAISARDEDCDVVCASMMSNSHLVLGPALVEELASLGRPDLPVYMGGILPQEDIPSSRNRHRPVLHDGHGPARHRRRRARRRARTRVQCRRVQSADAASRVASLPATSRWCMTARAWSARRRQRAPPQARHRHHRLARRRQEHAGRADGRGVLHALGRRTCSGAAPWSPSTP